MDIGVTIFIVLVLIALAFVIGIIIGKRQVKISYDGSLDIVEEDARSIFGLDIVTEPEELKDKKYIVLKVQKIPAKLKEELIEEDVSIS